MQTDPPLLKILRVSILTIMVILFVGLSIPFLLRWSVGWIEITSNSDSAEIFVLNEDGTQDLVGQGSVRFSQGKRRYSFIVKENEKETIITGQSKGFSTTHISATLVALSSSQEELPINARYLFADKTGLLHLDPDNSSLLRSIDQRFIPSPAFKDLSSARTVYWVDANNAIIQTAENELVSIVNGTLAPLPKPLTSTNESEQAFLNVPIAVNSKGQAALISGNALFGYSSLVDSSPTTLATDVDESSLLAYSNSGLIAYLHVAEVGSDLRPEDTEGSTEMIIEIFNTNTGKRTSSAPIDSFPGDLPVKIRWSPDGNTLAISTIFGLFLMDGDVLVPDPLIVGSAGLPSNLTWADKDTIIFSKKNDLWRANTKTKEVQKLITSELVLELLGGVSEYNNRIFFSGKDPALFSSGSIQSFILPVN